MTNIREAIALYIDDCRDAGDPIPTEARKEFVEVEAADPKGSDLLRLERKSAPLRVAAKRASF